MSGPDRAIWDDVLAHLRDRHPHLCRRWFDELEVLSLERGTLALRVPQPARRQYLERECAAPFAEAAQAVTGHLVSVRFLDEDEGLGSPAPAPAVSAAGRALEGPASSAPSEVAAERGSEDAGRRGGFLSPFSSRRAPEQLALSPDYAFENFVTGPENRLAHAAAVAVADNPGRAYNPVFFHGGVGLGKTHLLQAICHRVLERSPDAKLHYLSCEEFVTQFMEAVEQGQMSGFRHRFRDSDALVIDDIHFLAQRDRIQEEFFHTFNTLYQSHKQIVLSSDAPPDQIPDLEERLVSRFKWGLVARIEKPLLDTRVAIVRKKAELRGLSLGEDVARAVAARIDSNIRELEGAVVRLQIQASVERRAIDVALVESILGPIPSANRPPVSITVIIDAVAGFYSVKLSDLQSKRRQKSIAHPRQLCMYFARRHTPLSLEEIGGYFGGRDHTTVMHAVKTIQERIDGDREFAGVVSSLEQRIAQVR